MSRRLIAWLVSLPLAVVGTQVAHALAYRLATPADTPHGSDLSTTGHGYLAYLPLGLAVGAVLVALALLAEIRHVAARRDRPDSSPPAWQFAALTPAIFTLQEHFERLFQDGVFPWGAALAASFIIGLLLQVPFALVAYALARALLHAARSLGELLARPRGRWSLRHSIDWPRTCAPFPRLPALALGYGSRGPPLASR